MGTEVATYISQLQPSWPVGGVDQYSTADDHLRTLKTVLQTQFPNLGAVAVTPTAAQLNFVAGVTSAIQTQLDGKEVPANKNIANGYAGLNASAQLSNAQVSAGNVTQHQGSIAIAGSQITSGSIPDARIPSTGVTQHQASLSLAASQLTSGSVPDARIPQSNVTQHQSALSLAATQLTSGSIPDARVPASNVTQHQASLSIGGSQLTSGSIPDARVPLTNVSQHQASLTTRNISSKTGVAKTLQSGGSPSGGSDGDIIYIY